MSAGEAILARLQTSDFRRRFRLNARDAAYLAKHGEAAILRHAADFVARRLAPAQPLNDGRQTPMRGHPVFVAQHATATSCRGCLQRWHGLQAGRALGADEQAYVVEVIALWLRTQSEATTEDTDPQLDLEALWRPAS